MCETLVSRVVVQHSCPIPAIRAASQTAKLLMKSRPCRVRSLSAAQGTGWQGACGETTEAMS